MLPLESHLETFARLPSPRGRRPPLLFVHGGYIDGYRMFHKDEGYSFPTWDPHVRLDYAFLPLAFSPRLIRCEIVRDAPGIREASDHFPLLSEIADA